MKKQEKKTTQDKQLSEDDLKKVAGGTDFSKAQAGSLGNQDGIVENIQETRLEGLDARDKK